jgi:hypothetical protein
LLRFPQEQVLLLFQEDMFRNTFRALRMVEHFLSVPCFDFSSVALAQPLAADRSGTGVLSVYCFVTICYLTGVS